MGVTGESARVLVTVKATPQPSEQYGDTVCVAGLRLDQERASWIRLYPVPFRWLSGDTQFSKYALVNVDVERRDKDTRVESYRPDIMSLKVDRIVPPGQERHEYIASVEPTTTCALHNAALASTEAPSLGLIYPADVDRIAFEPHAPWNDEQIRKMRARAAQEEGALLPTAATVPKPLVAPRFKMSYRYRCGAATCRGHTGRNLDWELTAFQNRLHNLGDAELRDAIEQKFLREMFADGRRSGFYLGNFEDPAKRAGFSILGVYWPKAAHTAEPPATLF